MLPVYSQRGVGLFGGGERYAYNLATALAGHCDVTLVTFGPRTNVTWLNGIEHLTLRAKGGNPTNPFPLAPLSVWRRFDLIHAHQIRTVVTTILALTCRALNKPLVVTDLGGGGRSPIQRLRLYRLIPRFVSISDFSKSLLPADVRSRATVLKGGVDVARFRYDSSPRARQVIQVGRIMPHKGMNYLIDAASGDVDVVIAGKVFDQKFYNRLRDLSKGKRVRFLLDPSDEALHREYTRSAVTVSASVHHDMYGDYHPMSELLGLTLLESMAVGTPTVCTAVGGMPEYVKDGVTGFVVAPNSSAELRRVINLLVDNPSQAHQMGLAGHEYVQQYSWERLARCLSHEYERILESKNWGSG